MSPGQKPGLFGKYVMSWTNLSRVTAPLDSVVTLAEAKGHLRVSHADEDALIINLIEAATSYVEGPNGIGVSLLTQTWRASFDGFPCGSFLIPLGPIQSITSIQYRDGAGQMQTLSADRYDVDLDQEPCRIHRAPGSSWPALTVRPGSVKVTFQAGYGSDPEDIPVILRQAILLLIGHWYEERSDTTAMNVSSIPHGVEAILNRYRVA